jgi:hypothetical protein
MTTTLFRAILLFAVLAGLAAGTIDALCPSLIPESLATASMNQPDLLTTTDGWVSVSLLTAWAAASIISTIGLFFFWPWARPVALLSTLVGVPIPLLTGAAVYSGWSTALLEVSSIAWGAVLAFAYFSSLSARFVDDDSPCGR